MNISPADILHKKMPNPVRSTTKNIATKAANVRINRKKIFTLAQGWVKSKIQLPKWPAKLHFRSADSRKVLDYLIILDSLNFCFWPKIAIGRSDAVKPQEKWSIMFKGQRFDGYFALSITLKVYFEKHPSRANFRNFSNITYPDFLSMFRGSKNLQSLQFLRRRWQTLKAVSRHMLQHYEGNSVRLVEKGEKRLSKLVPLLAAMPSFNDVANYRGKKVFLWKRAQILGGDIMGALNNRGLGKFLDPGYLTAFPDYKLPQILRHYGIFEYSDRLESKIRERRKILAGSIEEIEIRAATVRAVEILASALKKISWNCCQCRLIGCCGPKAVPCQYLFLII